MRDTPCAAQSEQAGEGLWGTAVAHTSLWVALEVREPWGRKAFEECAIGARAFTALEKLADSHPELRIQLIRRPEQRTGDPALYVARTAYGRQGLWRVPITGYPDIASINWAGWARGEVAWSAWLQRRPVYLVCVHGRRDRCCAERGMPVYKALRERAPDRTWQTSHLGGHRFAATLLTLPDGLCYGRVPEDEAGALFDAREEGRIHDVARLRGRTALAGVAQAAECAIRQHTGDLALTDMRMEELEEDDAGVIRVAMRSQDGSRRCARLRRVEAGRAAASCEAEPEVTYRYEVVSVE